MSLTSKVQIATRVDRELFSKIKRIQEDMQADRSVAIRRLLEEGARHYELKRAIELLREGKVTVSKAAEIAGVSIWDLMETMRIKKVPIPYTAEDLRKSLELRR
jgi:predicted HTH domain antitoxin